MSRAILLWTACVAASTHLNLQETLPKVPTSTMGPQEEDYHSNDPQPAKRLTGIVDNVWYASNRPLYTEP